MVSMQDTLGGPFGREATPVVLLTPVLLRIRVSLLGSWQVLLSKVVQSAQSNLIELGQA